MALLYLKHKLFPEPKQTKSKDRLLETHTNSDIESQRSYSTFCNPSDEDRDSFHGSDDSNGSDSTLTRTRINPRIISDAILGMSDGLTVPFALSAGLSALGDTRVVVLGGLAELMAGAISMGLGGYVGAKSEAESYETAVRETKELIETSPASTTAIVHSIFAAHGIPDDVTAQINHSLHASSSRDDNKLLNFLMDVHHKESAPDCNQAWISAVTLGLGYFVGGFIPLIPYFIVEKVVEALWWSVAVMAVTLLVFGYVKTCIVRGWAGSENILAGVRGGIEMCVVGGVAAGAAVALVKLIQR